MFGVSRMLISKGGLSALATIAALGLAVSASAQITHSLPMTGTWFQNRGPLVDIPVNGGPTFCGPKNVMAGCIGQGGVNFAPANGGVPNQGVQSLMITIGSTANDPARFTVPTFAFGQSLGTQNTHVSFVPTVVQLDTHFSLNGPGAETGGPNVDRVFEKNAWAVQGHTGRLGLTFAWCPNYAGPPPCPGPMVRPGGPESGIVRYSNPGGNGFGGTMAMIQNSGPSGTGTEPHTVWVTGGTAGGGTRILVNQPFGFATAPQHPGRGYASYDPDNLSSGPVYIGFMTSNQTALQTGINGPMNGLITFIGPMIPTPNPADTNENWGFPWTTGRVQASNIQTNMGAMGTTVLSGTGSDNRTQLGAGTITLVAGGTTHRIGAGQDFAAFDIVTMTVPEPGAALALGLSLAAIGGLYRLRRRF